MQIVDKKMLCRMPNGTLFCTYQLDILTSNFYVITGHNERYDGVGNRIGFQGALPLEPNFEYGDATSGAERITNWTTIDICDHDFDKQQLFAVFSKTEIRAMITVLQYALSDCNFSIDKFMDTYYCGDFEIDEKELDSWRDQQ